MKEFVIKNLNGIRWRRDHYIPEEEIGFDSFIKSGEIAVGDKVRVENKEECVLPLSNGHYCLTFNKGNFFTEESFSLAECKILFGVDFDY
jgi:hypothetical protein